MAAGDSAACYIGRVHLHPGVSPLAEVEYDAERGHAVVFNRDVHHTVMEVRWVVGALDAAVEYQVTICVVHIKKFGNLIDWIAVQTLAGNRRDGHRDDAEYTHE